MSDACRDNKGHFAPCDKQEKPKKGKSPTTKNGVKPHRPRSFSIGKKGRKTKFTRVGGEDSNMYRVEEPGHAPWFTNVPR